MSLVFKAGMSTNAYLNGFPGKLYILITKLLRRSGSIPTSIAS